MARDVRNWFVSSSSGMGTGCSAVRNDSYTPRMWVEDGQPEAIFVDSTRIKIGVVSNRSTLLVCFVRDFLLTPDFCFWTALCMKFSPESDMNSICEADLDDDLCWLLLKELLLDLKEGNE